MSGARFDYSSERQRHEKFVGRAELLARLDQLLVGSETVRWVVVTGGPGMGKSALLAAWLARREAAGAVVPHHFIRRGAYDWDDPAKLVGSLVAQIADGFPELREPDGDERMHPATRLARALSRVSEVVLRPRGERMVVLIDGLDEYDPSAGMTAGDPLAAFLPDALPAGVRLLCASRPRHPYVSSLESRDGELVQIDRRDPEAKAILIKPRIGWCVLPKRSHGVEWHHHVSTNAFMHYVDAITGVDGTPQEACLSTHWQYADSYIIADADLSDDSL